MSADLVPDDLWERVAPLLPPAPERRRRHPGRLRVPGRAALAGVMYVPAAEAAALGLIDEYRAVVHPVLVGGGIPFSPRHERRVALELVETRTFSSRVVNVRYSMAR